MRHLKTYQIFEASFINPSVEFDKDILDSISDILTPLEDKHIHSIIDQPDQGDSDIRVSIAADDILEGSYFNWKDIEDEVVMLCNYMSDLSYEFHCDIMIPGSISMESSVRIDHLPTDFSLWRNGKESEISFFEISFIKWG